MSHARSIILASLATLWLLGLPASAQSGAALPATQLRILGGLARVDQYTEYEMPFWTQHVRERSGGRITGEISPFGAICAAAWNDSLGRLLDIQAQRS